MTINHLHTSTHGPKSRLRPLERLLLLAFLMSMLVLASQASAHAFHEGSRADGCDGGVKTHDSPYYYDYYYYCGSPQRRVDPPPPPPDLSDEELAQRAREECDALQQSVDWPSNVPKGNYVRTYPGVPSTKKQGATSFEIEYEGGFCHVVIDSDGTVVHRPHYREWTKIDPP